MSLLIETEPNSTASAPPLIGELRAIVNRGGDTEELFTRIAQTTAAHLDAPSLRIWGLGYAADRLQLKAMTGAVLPFEGLQDDVPVAGSELGRVITSREPCEIDFADRNVPADVKAWATRTGAKSFYAIPVHVKEQRWGVLAVFLRNGLDSPERDLIARVVTVVSEVAAREALHDRSGEPDLLASLMPCLSSALMTLDHAGRVTHWSSMAERMFGWSETDVLGKPSPLLTEESRNGSAPDRIQRGRSVCQRADLSNVAVHRTTGPLYNRHGEAIGRIELLTDDSQRAQTFGCLQVQAQLNRILTSARGLDEALSYVLSALGEWLDCDTVEFWRFDPASEVLSRAGLWAKSEETRSRMAAVDVRLKASSDEWPARMLRQNDVAFAEEVVSPGRTNVLNRPTARLAVPIFSAEDRLGIITCSGWFLRAPDELTSQTLQFAADALAQFLLRLQTAAELAKSEASLRQTQKMDAIGLLAGGVAHDFNNLLTIILAYSEMGLAEVETANPLRELFAEIHGAGERAAAMTKKLLAVSRQQPAQPVACQMNALVTGMDRMLQRLLGPQFTLSLQCDPALSQVKADVNQLEQVLLNLVVNARDAMPNGGTITISTRNVNRTARETREHGLTPGAFVELEVRDTGCGMDKATLARIFEPFFTTKGVGKGTGMGLSTVFGIIQQHGGFIEVESEPNVGTTFSVNLPHTREVLATQSIDAAPESQPVGTESVLVVENDDSLRLLIRRLLELRGYKVHEATHGGDALKLLDARKPKIDLVISDVALPVVDGITLARSVLGRRNGPKLMMISANAEPPDDLGLDLSQQFLRKPFASSELARQVRRALEFAGAKG